MSDCTYCADSGWSSIGMMCRCPKGAALRMQASRSEILNPTPAPTSASLHAQWMLGPAEVGPIASGVFPDDDLTHPTMAERLRSIGSREPVTKVQHYCAVCGVDLLAGQPCGGWCHACATQAAKAKLEFKREDWRITWAGIIGLVTGVLCGALILWGLR